MPATRIMSQCSIGAGRVGLDLHVDLIRVFVGTRLVHIQDILKVGSCTHRYPPGPK